MAEKTVERFVIQLRDGKFAAFEQETSTELYVNNVDDFTDADFLGSDEVEEIFREMEDKDQWEFFGECTEPAKIRRVTINLENE